MAEVSDPTRKASHEELAAFATSMDDILDTCQIESRRLVYGSRVYESWNNAMVLPSIFIASVISVVGGIGSQGMFGALFIAVVSAMNAFGLAVNQHLRYGVVAEAHRSTSLKYEQCSLQCNAIRYEIAMTPDCSLAKLRDGWIPVTTLYRAAKLGNTHILSERMKTGADLEYQKRKLNTPKTLCQESGCNRFKAAGSTYCDRHLLTLLNKNEEDRTQVDPSKVVPEAVLPSPLSPEVVLPTQQSPGDALPSPLSPEAAGWMTHEPNFVRRDEPETRICIQEGCNNPASKVHGNYCSGHSPSSPLGKLGKGLTSESSLFTPESTPTASVGCSSSNRARSATLPGGAELLALRASANWLHSFARQHTPNSSPRGDRARTLEPAE
jgi:hypothetical protein